MIRPALISLALLSACAPPLVVQQRPVEVQVPKGSSSDTPMPLVVLLHGYGVNGTGQDLIFPFSKQVDALQFRYALPSGTQDASGKRFWNATEACCNFGDLPVDDVAFFREVVEQVKAQYAVTKVFVVGHSNGAFMGLRLACDAPDALDGLVAVSGSTWLDPGRCGEGPTIPVLLVHGDADDTIFYEGREGVYPSAHVTGERFAKRAGCTPQWSTLARADFIGDATEETVKETTGCASPVELWTLEGGPHALVFDERWTSAVHAWLTEKAP